MPEYDSRYPSIYDLESRASRRIPRFALDYLRGGIGNEVGLQRNRKAFDEIQLIPRYLTDVSSCNISTNLYGENYSMPIGISPVGLAGMIWPGSESILARSASRAKIPFVLSTVGTVTLETISEISEGKAWFQLYPTTDPQIANDLLLRCKASGYQVLVVTLDVPVGAKRERELRSGLTLPLRFSLENFARAALCPHWSIALLRNGIPRFETLAKYTPPTMKSVGGMAAFASQLMMSGVTADYIKRIRDEWQGKLVIKGIMHPEDAISVCDLGVDGLIVSNHGGRQMDAAPATIQVLPDIVNVVGKRCTVMLDSGVRNGADVLRAVALGAKFVFSGRSFYYGVAAHGKTGGTQAIEIFRDEISRGLAQLGCTDINLLDQKWLAK